LGRSGRGVVIPFPVKRTQIGGGRSQRLADRALELLGEVERELAALQPAPGGEHPGPGQLGRFVRCELSREESRSVVRHLLTGCPACAALVNPLLGRGNG
jgi:hypothetical protein